MHYTGQVYRHPVEAQTTLLEVTIGCSHNVCAFCTMYRDTPFKVSPLDHIIEDLEELRSNNPNITRIFLVNGEPFILSTEKLLKIGELINEYLPKVKTITCYASIKSLKNKSVEDLKKLKQVGYDELHIGLESAYDKVLLQMNKGFHSNEADEGIKKLIEAGMKWDAILMLGVAGKHEGSIHINKTAQFINKYPPYMISIMTTSVSSGTPLETLRDNNEFIECTEREKIEEEKLLISLVDVKDCFFFGGHYYNLIPFNGPMTKKKEMIDYINQQLKKMDDKILDSVYPRNNI